MGTFRNQVAAGQHRGMADGRGGLYRGLGRARIRARRFGMRSSARRLIRRRALVCSFASSADGTSTPRMRRRGCPPIAGYAKGVPMGGDLRAAPAGQVTNVPCRRAQGPASAPTSTAIQIVKGWMDGSRRFAGEGLRRCLGGRPASPARTASCRRSETPLTSPNATWTNTIGAPELIAVVEGPGLRSGVASLLLRPCHRDPDTALDGV